MVTSHTKVSRDQQSDVPADVKMAQDAMPGTLGKWNPLVLQGSKEDGIGWESGGAGAGFGVHRGSFLKKNIYLLDTKYA